jgi:lysophospholipase L1-like esterase
MPTAASAHAFPPAHAGAPRWLALGDSYTIGEGVDEAARWPSVTAAGLRARGLPVAAPRVIATTGWTTDELSAAMDAAGPLGQWDLVSLFIGVNDQYRGRDAEADFRPGFRALLLRAIALAGGRPGRVFTLAIPDWGVTPFGLASGRDPAVIAAQLDAFNAVVAHESARHGVALVDIAPLSRMRGGEPAMVASDGLHPSAALHAGWAALALPVAERLLAS